MPERIETNTLLWIYNIQYIVIPSSNFVDRHSFQLPLQQDAPKAIWAFPIDPKWSPPAGTLLPTPN